jgi:casein kinase 1
MSKARSFNEPVPEKEKQPSHVKLGVVARLRREVGSARRSKELAVMVADFARVTNRSTGRTMSKVIEYYPNPTYSTEV